MSKVKMSRDLIVKCRTKEEAEILWNWYKKNGYVNNESGRSDNYDKKQFINLATSNSEMFTVSKSEVPEWDTILPDGKTKVVYASDIDFEDNTDNETTKEPSKATVHESLCNLIHETYVKKNADYGDSFGESIKDFGYTAGLVRISDKWNRIKNLLSGSEAQVNDESVKDTLLDMANYCIMLYMEIK